MLSVYFDQDSPLKILEETDKSIHKEFSIIKENANIAIIKLRQYLDSQKQTQKDMDDIYFTSFQEMEDSYLHLIDQFRKNYNNQKQIYQQQYDEKKFNLINEMNKTLRYISEISQIESLDGSQPFMQVQRSLKNLNRIQDEIKIFYTQSHIQSFKLETVNVESLLMQILQDLQFKSLWNRPKSQEYTAQKEKERIQNQQNSEQVLSFRHPNSTTEMKFDDLVEESKQESQSNRKRCLSSPLQLFPEKDIKYKQNGLADLNNELKRNHSSSQQEQSKLKSPNSLQKLKQIKDSQKNLQCLQIKTTKTQLGRNNLSQTSIIPKDNIENNIYVEDYDKDQKKVNFSADYKNDFNNNLIKVKQESNNSSQNIYLLSQNKISQQQNRDSQNSLNTQGNKIESSPVQQSNNKKQDPLSYNNLTNQDKYTENSPNILTKRNNNVDNNQSAHLINSSETVKTNLMSSKRIRMTITNPDYQLQSRDLSSENGEQSNFKNQISSRQRLYSCGNINSLMQGQFNIQDCNSNSNIHSYSQQNNTYGSRGQKREQRSSSLANSPHKNPFSKKPFLKQNKDPSIESLRLSIKQKLLEQSPTNQNSNKIQNQSSSSFSQQNFNNTIKQMNSQNFISKEQTSLNSIPFNKEQENNEFLREELNNSPKQIVRNKFQKSDLFNNGIVAGSIQTDGNSLQSLTRFSYPKRCSYELIKKSKGNQNMNTKDNNSILQSPFLNNIAVSQEILQRFQNEESYKMPNNPSPISHVNLQDIQFFTNINTEQSQINTQTNNKQDNSQIYSNNQMNNHNAFDNINLNTTNYQITYTTCQTVDNNMKQGNVNIQQSHNINNQYNEQINQNMNEDYSYNSNSKYQYDIGNKNSNANNDQNNINYEYNDSNKKYNKFNQFNNVQIKNQKFKNIDQKQNNFNVQKIFNKDADICQQNGQYTQSHDNEVNINSLSERRQIYKQQLKQANSQEYLNQKQNQQQQMLQMNYFKNIITQGNNSNSLIVNNNNYCNIATQDNDNSQQFNSPQGYQDYNTSMNEHSDQKQFCPVSQFEDETQQFQEQDTQKLIMNNQFFININSTQNEVNNSEQQKQECLSPSNNQLSFSQKGFSNSPSESDDDSIKNKNEMQKNFNNSQSKIQNGAPNTQSTFIDFLPGPSQIELEFENSIIQGTQNNSIIQPHQISGINGLSSHVAQKIASIMNQSRQSLNNSLQNQSNQYIYHRRQMSARTIKEEQDDDYQSDLNSYPSERDNQKSISQQQSSSQNIQNNLSQGSQSQRSQNDNPLNNIPLSFKKVQQQGQIQTSTENDSQEYQNFGNDQDIQIYKYVNKIQNIHNKYSNSQIPDQNITQQQPIIINSQLQNNIDLYNPQSSSKVENTQNQKQISDNLLPTQQKDKTSQWSNSSALPPTSYPKQHKLLKKDDLSNKLKIINQNQNDQRTQSMYEKPLIQTKNGSAHINDNLISKIQPLHKKEDNKYLSSQVIKTQASETTMEQSNNQYSQRGDEPFTSQRVRALSESSDRIEYRLNYQPTQYEQEKVTKAPSTINNESISSNIHERRDMIYKRKISLPCESVQTVQNISTLNDVEQIGQAISDNKIQNPVNLRVKELNDLKLMYSEVSNNIQIKLSSKQNQLSQNSLPFISQSQPNIYQNLITKAETKHQNSINQINRDENQNSQVIHHHQKSQEMFQSSLENASSYSSKQIKQSQLVCNQNESLSNINNIVSKKGVQQKCQSNILTAQQPSQKQLFDNQVRNKVNSINTKTNTKTASPLSISNISSNIQPNNVTNNSGSNSAVGAQNSLQQYKNMVTISTRDTSTNQIIVQFGGQNNDTFGDIHSNIGEKIKTIQYITSKKSQFKNPYYYGYTCVMIPSSRNILFIGGYYAEKEMNSSNVLQNLNQKNINANENLQNREFTTDILEYKVDTDQFSFLNCKLDRNIHDVTAVYIEKLNEIIVIGGKDENNNNLCDCFSINLIDHKIIEKSPLPQVASGFCCTYDSVKDTLYLLGGAHQNKSLNSVYKMQNIIIINFTFSYYCQSSLINTHKIFWYFEIIKYKEQSIREKIGIGVIFNQQGFTIYATEILYI